MYHLFSCDPPWLITLTHFNATLQMYKPITTSLDYVHSLLWSIICRIDYLRKVRRLPCSCHSLNNIKQNCSEGHFYNSNRPLYTIMGGIRKLFYKGKGIGTIPLCIGHIFYLLCVIWNHPVLFSLASQWWACHLQIPLCTPQPCPDKLTGVWRGAKKIPVVGDIGGKERPSLGSS